MNNIFSAKTGDICGALLLRSLCGAGDGEKIKDSFAEKISEIENTIIVAPDERDVFTDYFLFSTEPRYAKCSKKIFYEKPPATQSVHNKFPMKSSANVSRLCGI